GGLATIGIISARTLTLAPERPVVLDTAAARAVAVNPPAGAVDRLQSGDTVVRVGDTAVRDYRAFAAELSRQTSDPLQITIKRPAAADKPDSTAQEMTFEVPPQPVVGFGMVMAVGPITAIQANSPAADAGLKVGDTIVAVDGQSLDEAKT